MTTTILITPPLYEHTTTPSYAAPATIWIVCATCPQRSVSAPAAWGTWSSAASCAPTASTASTGTSSHRLRDYIYYYSYTVYILHVNFIMYYIVITLALSLYLAR